MDPFSESTNVLVSLPKCIAVAEKIQSVPVASMLTPDDWIYPYVVSFVELSSQFAPDPLSPQ